MNTSVFSSLVAAAPTRSIPLGSNGVPLGPSGPFALAPGGDPTLQRAQAYLYWTEFYKGRQDGLPDVDLERMPKAIDLVQIAAHLPRTRVFNDDVRLAIERFVRTGDFLEALPAAPLPVTVAAPPPPQRSLVRDLATFAILTSPAWGVLLLLQRPWTKLGIGTRRATR